VPDIAQLTRMRLTTCPAGHRRWRRPRLRDIRVRAPIPAVPASTLSNRSGGGPQNHPTGNAKKNDWHRVARRRPGREATVARRNSDRRNSPWWEVAPLGQAL